MNQEAPKFGKRIVGLNPNKSLTVDAGGLEIIIKNKLLTSEIREKKRAKARKIPEGAIDTLMPILREAFPQDSFGPDDEAFFLTFEERRLQKEKNELPSVSYKRVLSQLRRIGYSRDEIAGLMLDHLQKTREAVAHEHISEDKLDSYKSTVSAALQIYWPGAKK